MAIPKKIKSKGMLGKLMPPKVIKSWNISKIKRIIKIEPAALNIGPGKFKGKFNIMKISPRTINKSKMPIVKTLLLKKRTISFIRGKSI